MIGLRRVQGVRPGREKVQFFISSKSKAHRMNCFGCFLIKIIKISFKNYNYKQQKSG